MQAVTAVMAHINKNIAERSDGNNNNNDNGDISNFKTKKGI